MGERRAVRDERCLGSAAEGCMKRFLLSMAMVEFLCGLTQAGHAASGKKSVVAGPKAAAPNPADFVGSDVCATCHAEVASKFKDNPHAKLSLIHSASQGGTCESCHGPGKAHVDAGGDVTKIKQISKMT